MRRTLCCHWKFLKVIMCGTLKRFTVEKMTGDDNITAGSASTVGNTHGTVWVSAQRRSSASTHRQLTCEALPEGDWRIGLAMSPLPHRIKAE